MSGLSTFRPYSKSNFAGAILDPGNTIIPNSLLNMFLFIDTSVEAWAIHLQRPKLDLLTCNSYQPGLGPTFYSIVKVSLRKETW